MTAETKVNLRVTPLERTVSIVKGVGVWVWRVEAEETVSGARHDVGKIVSITSTASHQAKALAARERPDLTVLATIVEPTVGVGAS